MQRSKTKKRPDRPPVQPVAEGWPPRPAGALYLVGTPIGNLEDITLRALRVLREADLVACEDTRQTQKLLNHFDIQARTTSYHEHNEMTRAPELIVQLEEGARIALVTDAGMPAISDPGYRLVHLCVRHHVPVVPVPGPSAISAALAASGLPTHAFQFLGFLPPRAKARRDALAQLRERSETAILFEAPHRVLVLLSDVLEVLGDRHVVLAREITKLHEEFLRGECSAVLATLRSRPKIQGEITILIGAPAEGPQAKPVAAGQAPVKKRVDALMRDQKLSRMEALKQVARELGISKSEAWRRFES